MSNEEVIKRFLTEMATQDNRATASPFYYVIRSKRYRLVPRDHGDKSVFVYDGEQYDSEKELRAIFGDDKEEADDAVLEAEEFGLEGYWEEHGMFLTESDAKAHLEVNHYHYSNDAHTYVKHCWRAPQMKAFFEALNRHFNIAREETRDKGV